jgi:PBSX family phage portal protein
MTTRFESDDEEENINDGFHFDDPESESFGKERTLDIDLFDERDNFLSKELQKLNGVKDRFSEIPLSGMNKNSKRRAQRLAKRMEGINGVGSKYLPPETISGYDFYRLAVPPYNLDYLSDLSVENSTHLSAIQTKTINIVSDYKWEETNKVKNARMAAQTDDAKMEKLAKKLQRVQDGLDEWIESLNEDEGLLETLTKVWNDYEATGNAYIEVGRNRAGTISYLGHVPAASMRVRVDRDGFCQLAYGNSVVIFFRNYGDRKTPDPFNSDPNPNEIIHLKKYTPKNQYYGVPDIISAMTAIAGEKFASEYNLDYFENKAVPRYALIIKGAKLTAQAERRLLDYFRREVKGKHHGTLYIPVPAPMGTNVDVQLQAIENKIQEGSFVKYRQENRVEIAMAHRVPLSKLGIEGLGGGTAGPRESDKNFKVQIIRPAQRLLKSKMNLILKEFTDIYSFGFEEYDIVDEETKSRIDDRRIRNGSLSANEVRSKNGEAPRKGGDDFIDLAAESAATIATQLAQAKVYEENAKNAAKGLVAGGNTNSGPGEIKGGKKGAPRKTLDGGKNTPGSVKTPASETPTPKATHGSEIDAKGPRSRDR